MLRPKMSLEGGVTDERYLFSDSVFLLLAPGGRPRFFTMLIPRAASGVSVVAVALKLSLSETLRLSTLLLTEMALLMG